MPRTAPEPEAAIDEAKIPRRSHAAVPIVLAILVIGLAVGFYAVAVPFLLGILLLAVLASFLSTRVNPLAIGYYLTTKPSWAAIGTLFLSALLLFTASFVYFLNLHSPIVPFPVP